LFPNRVAPRDNLMPATEDLDWADIFHCLNRVFHIKLTPEMCADFDRTFDSLAKLVHGLTGAEKSPAGGGEPQ
jgi:hypothetical protein